MSRPYRPSNGSEGDWFMTRYCGHCRHYQELEQIGAVGCDLDIDANAFAFDVGEEGYPPEWVYRDDGMPTCTAFVSVDSANPTPYRPLPGQLAFLFLDP